jgi:mannose-6-phosphate isomerase-like protein (cupin superfamily)
MQSASSRLTRSRLSTIGSVSANDRFFVHPPTEGERISWRAEMLVKAASPATGGAFSLLETANPPDAGPPLHLHHTADEAFYVLEGSYEFHCGDEQVDAGPGWFVFLPHGVPHRYRAGPQGGRVLMLFSPGGTEDYFRDIAVAMADEATTEATLARLAEHHGIELLDRY